MKREVAKVKGIYVSCLIQDLDSPKVLLCASLYSLPSYEECLQEFALALRLASLHGVAPWRPNRLIPNYYLTQKQWLRAQALGANLASAPELRHHMLLWDKGKGYIFNNKW